jgi:hypothetical protein
VFGLARRNGAGSATRLVEKSGEPPRYTIQPFGTRIVEDLTRPAIALPNFLRMVSSYRGADHRKAMDDFPTPASLFGAGLLGMLLLATGVALDGGELADVAEVPALMGA